MISKKNKLSLIILCVLSLSTLAASSGVKVDVQLSPAGAFEIKTSKVRGKVVKTSQGYSAKKVSVRVKGFKTGMDLRDKHTREKLSYKKYPSITVRDIVAKQGKGLGTIKIMGIKKKVEFTYKELSKKLLEANFKLSLKDFGIKGISYMGVGVQDMVSVTAHLKISN